MLFVVYESGRLAKHPECNVHPSWNNCKFKSFEEALQYARHWLNNSYAELIINEEYYYGGGEDYVIIKGEA